MNNPTPLFVNATKAAQMCGVSESTFFRWVRQGTIKPVKIGANSKLYSVNHLRQISEIAA